MSVEDVFPGAPRLKAVYGHGLSVLQQWLSLSFILSSNLPSFLSFKLAVAGDNIHYLVAMDQNLDDDLRERRVNADIPSETQIM